MSLLIIIHYISCVLMGVFLMYQNITTAVAYDYRAWSRLESLVEFHLQAYHALRDFFRGVMPPDSSLRAYRVTEVETPDPGQPAFVLTKHKWKRKQKQPPVEEGIAAAPSPEKRLRSGTGQSEACPTPSDVAMDLSERTAAMGSSLGAGDPAPPVTKWLVFSTALVWLFVWCSPSFCLCSWFDCEILFHPWVFFGLFGELFRKDWYHKWACHKINLQWFFFLDARLHECSVCGKSSSKSERKLLRRRKMPYGHVKVIKTSTKPRIIFWKMCLHQEKCVSISQSIDHAD